MKSLMCVESRGHDSPHREQSKIDAVVPQLQFDCGCMGDGGNLIDDGAGLQEDMPYVVATTANWVRDPGYSQHTENQRHELQPS